MMQAAQGNVPFEPTAFRRPRLRQSLVAWMTQMGCSHAVTLNTNRALTITKLTRMFGEFCLELDRACLGRRNVHLVPAGDRLQGIAFIEHPESNIHLHAALRFACWWPDDRMDELRVVIYRLWSKVLGESGSIDLKPLRDDGWSYYISKAWNFTRDDYLLPSDYHPRA